MSNTITVLANYSDEYKAILFRVPKCANTSLKTFCPIPTIVKRKPRISIDKLKQFMGSKYDSYFKFAFVRNPYDRLVSCWNNKSSERAYKRRPDGPFGIARNTTFSEFVHMVEEDRISFNNSHVIPQVHIVPEGIDFIGRFENIQEDFNTVCDKVGTAQRILPHKHKNKHEHYTEYYNDETIEIVTNLYKEDLEVFGYEFGKL